MFKNKTEFKKEFAQKLVESYGTTVEETHPSERYLVLGDMVRTYASVNWKDSKVATRKQKAKQVYYFSMEFLLGRSLTSNLKNLGIYDIVVEGLKDLGISYDSIAAMERDAGVYYELMPTLGGHISAERQDENRLVEYYESLEDQLASLRRSCWGDDEQELDRLERMLLHAQGCYYIHEGIYDKGLPVLERLLRVSEAAGSREMTLNAHRQYVYYGIQTCDKELMHRHIESSAALIQDSVSPEYGVLLRLRGLLLLMQGKYEDARERFREAIRTFRTLEDRVDGKYAINIAGCYNYMAETYRLQGDYDSAFSHYDQAINYNRNREYYPGAAVFYTNYGVAAWQTGQRDEAQRMFRCAVRIYAGSHEYSAYPIALSYLAYYDAEDGCEEQAAERLQYALTLSRRIGSDWWTGITLYMMWKIRKLLEAKGGVHPKLASLWPADEREHCELALRYLQKLQPRLETDEMEQALHKL